jgi:hypothetical protein
MRDEVSYPYKKGRQTYGSVCFNPCILTYPTGRWASALNRSKNSLNLICCSRQLMSFQNIWTSPRFQITYELSSCYVFSLHYDHETWTCTYYFCQYY